MKPEEISEKACKKIYRDTDLVNEHLKVLEEMVRIDSRSFGVNEFKGDRAVPTDMEEILACAKNYLTRVGLPRVSINSSGEKHPFPILMGEIFVAEEKPTLLFYAHLDKQPYMDNEKFEKWGGVPPTKLRWNEDRSRAYGRGAADDLSGVVSIGMAIDALMKTFEDHAEDDSLRLPCNIKVIFETEEESGSHSLIEQIKENKTFFSGIDCVVITDVVNPAQGIPGLTTSLRGIIQMEVTVTKKSKNTPIDEQTALYKLLSKLIQDDHSLAVSEISESDQPVTDEERKGYSLVPTSVKALRETAGVLSGTRLTVPEDIASILIAQLRTSFANARPGHRISGSVILGTAGARLTFSGAQDSSHFAEQIEIILKDKNPFNLELKVDVVSDSPLVIDLILQSASKDPHSGVNGGPVPIPEIQLARMIDHLISDEGVLHPGLQLTSDNRVRVQSLFVDQGLKTRLYDDPTAKALVELRLAPGNQDKPSAEKLKEYLSANIDLNFELEIKEDKGASPWMTTISHPVFPLMLESLEKGFVKKPCLYGCGGTIPFVEKLMQALGDVQPLCLGAYDPDAKMHEPGESLSMPDLLGCTRSIIHLVSRIHEVYGTIKQ
ncbi:MAG: M20/M25/M40 family metallo-hydrolase [Nitrospinae bacterium]|nr:M20/M25/M40 family metallo-hydrolase [Nitrospinota bacterium]